MYTRWAEQESFTVESTRAYGDTMRDKSATPSPSTAERVRAALAERGVHRLVRISPFDAQKRRHNPFASLDVIPALDESEAEEFEIDEQDLRNRRVSLRAGGQGVNTTGPAGGSSHCRRHRGRMPRTNAPAPEQGHRDGHLEARLADLERRKREEQMNEIRGERKAVDFGSQIRSYVLASVSDGQDHRTNVEVGTLSGCLQGYRPLHRSRAPSGAPRIEPDRSRTSTEARTTL